MAATILTLKFPAHLSDGDDVAVTEQIERDLQFDSIDFHLVNDGGCKWVLQSAIRYPEPEIRAYLAEHFETEILAQVA